MTDSGSVPWSSGPYSIKRHGVTLTHCDVEPVQTPGCIQGCGTLLVLRRTDLTILQVGENCAVWLGLPPEGLLGQPVSTALGEEGAVQLRDLLAGQAVERSPLYAFTLPARPPVQPAQLDLTLHTLDGLAILELEPAAVASGPDAYALVRLAVARLQAESTLQDFCAGAAQEVRRVTGLDRVMIYRFHADGHGEVFAECRRDDLAPWLGLHYPAADIPRPAREIFAKIWVRPLPDAQGALYELVPLANPDTGQPLEMTYCALRGASVMYTEYLQNMGVAASLTMPLRDQGKLWGMIACHHYSAPAPMPWPMRAACELLAQMVSLRRKSVEDQEQLAYRLRIDSIHQQLLVQAAAEGDPAAMLVREPALLDGLDAGGAALYHRQKWWRLGQTPAEPELDALAAWLATRPELDTPTKPLYVTDSLSRDWPEGVAMAAVASGVLAIPLSRGRQSLMLWFRPETIHEVCWAGNPYDKPTRPGPHGPRLTPRASFELFRESVRNRSLPWLSVEVEAAERLQHLIMELVISRTELLAALGELDEFAYVASHDLKEPLRGIHMYAHQLLAETDALSQESRRQLDGIARLTVRMDGLLEALLEYSRVGRSKLVYEEVELGAVLDEAIEMVGARTAEKPCEFVVPRPLPTVRCDRTRIREVLVNLLSNALKYTDRPLRRIEVGYLTPLEYGTRSVLPIEARGHTVFFVRDNGLGIDRRHAEKIWKMFRRLHGRDAYGGGAGVGLTIVKKLIERHHGQVWVESALGEGSTFYFTLPAPLGAKGQEHERA